jgi:trans-2,3-dihydro-3-hydroxyanthranilate isomerase
MATPVAHRFHIVDVFAEQLHAGNTLAVVRDAGDLEAGTMQRIAREFGFSETTFITSSEESSATRAPVRAVRIFTPAEELPFAGHPTLGTAWVLREHLLAGRPAAVTLALGVGAVPVTFEREAGHELAWLTAPPVTFGKQIDAEALAPVLGLEARDFSRTLPAQHVRAGVEFVHVPLANEDAVRRARFDAHGFASLAAQGYPAKLYLFAPGAGADLHARMLFVAGSVREDPATGSATACLGAYLLAHGGRGERFSLRIEQGVEMGRPSLLRLEVTGGGGRVKIRVGGRVIESARGELL